MVNARWVNEAKLECDVTALIPQYIRDSFGENSLGMCENVAGGSVVERCVSYGKYNVIITQTYTIGSIPEAGTVMWQNTMLGQCDFFLTVIIPQRIELMSESEYSQSEDHVNDNKTVYMLYPDA